MRLIDADALKESIYCSDTDEKKVLSPKQLHEILDKWIDARPTIEERKTGIWCVTPDGKLVCSNCYSNPTNRIIVDGSLIYDMTPIRERMKYCPNCGSYNGGEENETD